MNTRPSFIKVFSGTTTILVNVQDIVSVETAANQNNKFRKTLINIRNCIVPIGVEETVEQVHGKILNS